ncbi:dynein light chain Tctex-type 1-like [Schistocerca gregaria]|uniref:dynein light chain Tctex-type 1-like n=1 Tax=Schistocerca gregaria TaxID=7010 RepID=UPI00211E4FA2|nr:dynein light chain Tctex-type 1-like [Schistocerca gregaria]
MANAGRPEPFAAGDADTDVDGEVVVDGEVGFDCDRVSAIVQDAIEFSIGGCTFQECKLRKWSTDIFEACLAGLLRLRRPYKYAVTCCIVPRAAGVALHADSACYWDTAVDGSCTVRWENASLYCIVSVFGMATTS